VLVHAMLRLTGGGVACSDIEALRAQERVFGAVVSGSTTCRTFRQIDPATLAGLLLADSRTQLPPARVG
jgi:hypothetical protein